jgi:hypothetical protein
MSARGPEFEHTLCNQVAIVVGFCELLLAEVPAGSRLRADIEEMHKAALKAMDMLRAPENAG